MLRFNFIIISAWLLSLPVYAQLSSSEVKVEAVDQVGVKSNGDWQLKFTNEADPTGNNWYFGASAPNWGSANNGVPYFAIGTGNSYRSTALNLSRNGEVTMGGTDDFDGVLKVMTGNRSSSHTAMFGGHSSYGPIWSFFNFKSNGRTYIRSGRPDAYVYIGDVGTQQVKIGNSSTSYNRDALIVRGGAIVQNGTWGTSDRTLKKNIRKFSKGLSVIDNINVVSYDYIEETTKNSSGRVGVLAQELQAVAPHLVKTIEMDVPTGKKDEYGNEIIEDKAKEVLVVNTEGLSFLLINAVKEQQLVIEQLKQEVALLKKLTVK